MGENNKTWAYGSIHSMNQVLYARFVSSIVNTIPKGTFRKEGRGKGVKEGLGMSIKWHS